MGSERLRLAFLGPAGTYSEQAALLHDREARLLPYPSFTAVARAVEEDEADAGVVAIENSLEGSVIETVDLLVHQTSLLICRELVVPVEHCLLARPGTKAEDVRVIYSHPQALGQSRAYLERHFPSARLEPSFSTAGAVQEAVKTGDAAAVGNRRAGEIYGAEVLASGIQERENNVTRFVVLAKEDMPPTGDDKTSIAFSFQQDRAGSLMEVLAEFAGRGLNLSKIESRPTREALGKYVFLVDVEGHRLDPEVAAALEGVRQMVAVLKVFGSYPRWRRP